ncbi:MAG: hypothetical protein E7159_04780 [Firmicutes bacterium]|nr:hypothetical protein [Bacillota bacterium]
MQLKKWRNYTKEEKKEILFHWWHYYGKLPYTIEELNYFNDLLDKDVDKMFICALCSDIEGYSSQMLIRYMRQDKVQEYLNTMPRFESVAEQSILERLSDVYLQELVGTLNNPEPDVPLTEEEMINGIKEILRQRKNTNNS